MPHQIRTSARRSFRGCRRRWSWAYVEGWAPLEEPKPLEFGRAFHTAMEEIYNPETWDLTDASDKLRLAKMVFELECEKQRNQYLRENGMARLDREGQDDYDERIKLGHGMLEYYIENVHSVPGNDDWFRPVRVEVEFDVPITNADGNDIRCYNSPECGQEHSNNTFDNDDNVVTHGGRVDCLVEDIVRGGYWVVDWKTAAELRANEDMLEFDDQLMTYLWALRNKLHIDIRGFVYVEIRKAFPQPPKRLARVRNGCAFSTDKRQPTTYQVYRDHVMAEDPTGYMNGSYVDFFEYLRTDKDAAKFHQRFVIQKTPQELTNVGENIALEVQDMVALDLRIYPSVGRFSCPSCAYRSPCQMKFGGNDYLFTLQSMFRKNV